MSLLKPCTHSQEQNTWPELHHCKYNTILTLLAKQYTQRWNTTMRCGTHDYLNVDRPNSCNSRWPCCESMIDTKEGWRVQPNFRRFTLAFAIWTFWQENISGNPSTVTETLNCYFIICTISTLWPLLCHVCLHLYDWRLWMTRGSIMGSIIRLKQ